MKKYFALFLSFLIILSFTVTIFADSNENSRSLETEFSHEIYKLADKHSTVIGDLKEFTPFEVNRHKIRLYTETLITADKAMELYPDAYNMCVEGAAEYNLPTSIDDREFQEFAKIYAGMNENGSEEFIAQCMEFARFLDYYENSDINKQILSLAGSKDESSAYELEDIMPYYGDSTAPADEFDFILKIATKGA